VPTIAEAGVPGYESILWFGLLTSSAVPASHRRQAQPRDVRILSDPDAKQRWIPIGLRPQPTTPEGFDKLIRDDVRAFTDRERGEYQGGSSENRQGPFESNNDAPLPAALRPICWLTIFAGVLVIALIWFACQSLVRRETRSAAGGFVSLQKSRSPTIKISRWNLGLGAPRGTDFLKFGAHMRICTTGAFQVLRFKGSFTAR